MQHLNTDDGQDQAVRFDSAVSRFLNGPVFAAGFFAYVGFFYPGFMSNDSVTHVLEGRSGVFTDWHPPALAHLWRMVEFIVPGPTGMLVFQSALIWFGAFLIYRAYFAARCSLVGAVCLVALMFFPPVFGIAGVIWKDILMWGFLLNAIGVAGHVKSPNSGNRRRPLLLLSATIFLALAAVLARHNAILAALPIIGLAVFRLWGEKSFPRLALALIVAAIVGGGVQLSAGLINSQLTDRKAHVWVALAIFDIAGVIVRLPDQTERERIYSQLPVAIREADTSEAVARGYHPKYWETMFLGDAPAFRPVNWETFEGFSYLEEEDLSTIRKVWLSVNRQHWREWLNHRWAVSLHVLGLLPEHLWSVAYMKTNGFSKIFEPYYGKNPEPSQFQHALERHLTSLDKRLMYRPWFYVVIALMILAVSVVRTRSIGHEAVFISMSALIHEAALIFVAPSPDFRYSHYMIFATLLSALLLARPLMQKLNLAICRVRPAPQDANP